jgi:TolB protein
MKTVLYTFILASGLFSSCNRTLPVYAQPAPEAPKTTASQNTASAPAQDYSQEPIHYAQERHFKNVRQLTYGGNNAEAYWSFDGKKLIFQSDNPGWGLGCDQIFLLDVNAKADSSKLKMISTGKGRTTCSWFMPDNKSILYASTHLGGDSCPPVPDMGRRYVWQLYPSYDIFVADLKGNLTKQLTTEARYDAEATISPKGDKIIFTSLRTGDLELYTMDIDGKKVKQITDQLGYDGGACFSADGSKIVWRASRPKSEQEKLAYLDLLNKDMVEPSNMEIWVANADGSDARQITNLGKANWAPTFTPKGDKIIFCSNYKSERGFPFNLYIMNIDGTGLEQLTFDDQFDSFPMFSPDGKKFVWCSNRHNGRTRDTNVFIADWVD